MSSPFVLAAAMIGYVVVLLLLQLCAALILKRRRTERTVTAALLDDFANSDADMADSTPTNPLTGRPEPSGNHDTLSQGLLSGQPDAQTNFDLQPGPASSLSDRSNSSQDLTSMRRCGPRWWRKIRKNPYCGGSWWLKKIIQYESFGPFAHNKEQGQYQMDRLVQKLKTVFLGFLMLGYVALGSYALAPLGCADLYGKRFMTSHPSIEVFQNSFLIA